MSMIGRYRRVTPQKFDELQRLLENDPEVLSDFLLPEESDSNALGLEIGKSWHGIYFLLNDTPSDEADSKHDIVFGGTEIGEDFGYGPARYLTPQEVKEAAIALTLIDRNELRERFNPAVFEAADIYPGGWTKKNPEEGFDGLWNNLLAVRDFFRAAAQDGDMVFLYLS